MQLLQSLCWHQGLHRAESPVGSNGSQTPPPPLKPPRVVNSRQYSALVLVCIAVAARQNNL